MLNTSILATIPASQAGPSPRHLVYDILTNKNGYGKYLDYNAILNRLEFPIKHLNSSMPELADGNFGEEHLEDVTLFWCVDSDRFCFWVK